MFIPSNIVIFCSYLYNIAIALIYTIG